MRGGLEQELEEVRRELLERLAELEPLPEAVRRSELQLQETQDRERSQERRSMELSTTLTDLRMKVRTQVFYLITKLCVTLCCLLLGRGRYYC